MRLAAAALLLSAGVAAAEPSPVGLWASAEDQVSPARQIRLTAQGGVLSGKIVRTDTARDTICFKCDDDRKGQPILGMEVLRGARHDGENWLGGQWLEPQTGTLYRTRLTLAEDGGTLTMRGTVGLALMGRSQVWTRVAEDAPMAVSVTPASKMVRRVPPPGPGEVFISAQGPERDGATAPDFAGQARGAWANLDARLAEAGTSRAGVTSVTVILADRADVAAERSLREAMLPDGSAAVTVMIAGLPDRAWLLEIAATARNP